MIQIHVNGVSLTPTDVSRLVKLAAMLPEDPKWSPALRAVWGKAQASVKNRALHQRQGT